jgi:hypothetical protein
VPLSIVIVVVIIDMVVIGIVSIVIRILSIKNCRFHGTRLAKQVRVHLVVGALVPAAAAGQAMAVDAPARQGAVPAGHAVAAAVEGEEA